MRHCQTETPARILKLAVKYPSAARLKRAKVKTVAEIPYLPKIKAQKVVTDAKRSVASTTDMATEQLVVATAHQIIHLNKTIDGQTRRMIETCVMPEVKLLKTLLRNFKENVSEMLLFRRFVFRLKAGCYQ